MSRNILLTNTNKANELNYKLYSKLFSNEWDLYVIIKPKYRKAPNTIVSKFKNHMRGKSFDSNNYKYLFVPTENNTVEGYISLKENTLRVSVGLSAKPIEEFITAAESTPDVFVNIKPINKTKPLNTVFFTDSANWFFNYRTGKHNCWFSNSKGCTNFIKNLTEGFVLDYCKIHDGRSAKNWNYVNYHNFRGVMGKKTIKIFPLINQNGDGIIHFLIDEKNKNGKLERRTEAHVFVHRFEAVMNNGNIYHYSHIDNKQLFVYVCFEKKTGNIVYTGQSQSFPTRGVRHMNPQEKDSLNSFLNGKVKGQNSTIKGYAFYSECGSVEVNETTVQRFKEFVPSWKKYDFRLLPLTHYKIAMKASSKEWQHQTDLQHLPEAYVMSKLLEQSPNKIIYTTPEMSFINKKIKAHNVPLWYLSNGSVNNESLHSTEIILCRHDEIASTGYLEHLMKQTLSLVRGVNLEPITNWYDLLMQYGLNVQEAVYYSVGLPIDANPAEDDLIMFSQDVIDNRNYKHTVANTILEAMNYKSFDNNK